MGTETDTPDEYAVDQLKLSTIRHVMEQHSKKRISTDATLAVAAVARYVLAEIITAATAASESDQKTKIYPKHINQGISFDKELKALSDSLLPSNDLVKNSAVNGTHYHDFVRHQVRMEPNGVPRFTSASAVAVSALKVTAREVVENLSHLVGERSEEAGTPTIEVAEVVSATESFLLGELRAGALAEVKEQLRLHARRTGNTDTAAASTTS